MLALRVFFMKEKRTIKSVMRNSALDIHFKAVFTVFLDMMWPFWVPYSHVMVIHFSRNMELAASETTVSPRKFSSVDKQSRTVSAKCFGVICCRICIS